MTSHAQAQTLRCDDLNDEDTLAGAAQIWIKMTAPLPRKASISFTRSTTDNSERRLPTLEKKMPANLMLMH